MKTKSKKQLVAAIVAGLTLATAAPALAAANPFVDVPAKHWAYDSVSKLAADGIIDGYGDGTFRGDRTMTRYEMAQIVGKAMANQDKANAEQKAMIDKLAKEFSDELDNLGVRVAKLEKKIGNITWSGQVREWYQWQDKDYSGYNERTDLQTRLLLWMEAPLTKDLTFKGRVSAFDTWGGVDHRVGTAVEMDNAYLQGKNFTFGRQGIILGKGLVYNALYNNDGITYTFGEDKLKLTAAVFKNADVANLGISTNIYAANVAYKASDKLDLTAVYAKNKEEDFGVEVLDTWALGFEYKGIKNVSLVGEYGINGSDGAKITNGLLSGDFDDAKAWVARATYKGAEWTKPHTWGFWVGYRDADPGFWSLTGDPLWESHLGVLRSMNDVKGMEVGFDYTLFNNGVLTVNYMDFESNDFLQRDLKGMTAQLRYFF